MATEKAAQGFVAKFMHWYESYDGKNIVNIVYSAGASVVIIGALFKILHWPGASQVLMIGMFTEAFLFLIGTLEHPHPEFHWENVFPQLLEYGTKPELLEEKSKQARPTLLGAGVAVSIITRANPFVPDSLQLVNRVTAAIQNELCGYTGIRCCKRAVWASVRGTICALGLYGGPGLELSDIHCRYAFTHNACIGENCPYCVSGSGQASRNC